MFHHVLLRGGHERLCVFLKNCTSAENRWLSSLRLVVLALVCAHKRRENSDCYTSRFVNEQTRLGLETRKRRSTICVDLQRGSFDGAVVFALHLVFSPLATKKDVALVSLCFKDSRFFPFRKNDTEDENRHKRKAIQAHKDGLGDFFSTTSFLCWCVLFAVFSFVALIRFWGAVTSNLKRRAIPW